MKLFLLQKSKVAIYIYIDDNMCNLLLLIYYTAPTIVSTSKSQMMVSAGGTITLFCEATSDTPVTYEWIRNGLKLTNNG